MIPTLDTLLARHYLSDLDYHFAVTAARISGEQDPLVLLGAAVASRFTNLGHICANIDQLAGEAIDIADGEPAESLSWPDATTWRSAIERSPMVSGDGKSLAPLVLGEDGGLYLYRYWSYQQRLAHQLRLRASQGITTVEEETLSNGINRLFPSPDGSEEIDEQQQAARMALRNRLSIISGGPGTGKTSVVVKILALLLEQADSLGQNRPAIVLMAPTGKAAARLTESIRQAKIATGPGTLHCRNDIVTGIPEEAATIHRVLGTRFDKPTQFRYGVDNPLPADVVIVDESSMIDLALITKLIEAVKPTARLILLGDKDQLTSVGSGAILGDIYNTFSSRTSRFTHCISHFTHSYRFDSSSGMGNLARAINQGAEDEAIACLKDSSVKEVAFIPMSPSLNPTDLRRAIERFVPDLSRLFAHTDPEECLAIQKGFRILCAHRHGVTGAATVNTVTESILRQKGLIRSATDWYAGRPVIINQNDYQLKLFNGDVGVLGERDPTRGDLYAFFAKTDGEVRYITPSRLPSHETVYAMTVHKSQGSEFDRVLVILPDRPSPVLTRELLYTAVTRAKKKLTIFSSEAIIRTAIQTRIQRASGLTNLLA